MDLSLPLAFTVGLFSSLHCIGMCGGIIGALSYGLTDEVRQSGSRFGLFLLTLSTGRILSYAVAGALLGYLGGTLLEVLEPIQGHRLLQWLAALIMVLIGLHIAGWLPKLSIIERAGVPLWRLLEPVGRSMMPVGTLPRALAYGLVWGWLPCGLVYTMLISTATKSGPVSGALYMMAFGLGTLPSVLVTGMLAGKLYHAARQPYLRIAVGLVVVLMGLASLWFPELLESRTEYPLTTG
ncbi:MAG: sulfite exporter TauE/SafE family protein [Sedimenticola sp.]